jgi:branched-chain amino acid transport system ATP-binding protein
LTLLAVEDLVVRYGALTALRGASIRVEKGEIFFVTGPNGAGKSTLMKAIAGVVRPASGAVALGGQPILGEAPETIARRGFSMVPEGRQVFGSLTVEENLRLGAGMRADRAAVASDLAQVYATFPMLAERKGGPAGLLSGGQQQMLVIARALMTAPRLIAIDEPSLGLAPVVIDQVYELLLRLRAERGLTLLIVEQSSTRAMMTGGRMVLMRSGRVVLEGDARTLGRSDALERAYFGYEDGAPAA